MVVVLLAVAVGCGAPSFQDGSFDELETALRDDGLRICSERTAEAPHDAVAAVTYEVAVNCDQGDQTTVDAVEWQNKEARDAAEQRAEGGGRLNPTPAWAFGVLTVSLPGFTDAGSQQRVAQTLERISE